MLRFSKDHPYVWNMYNFSVKRLQSLSPHPAFLLGAPSANRRYGRLVWNVGERAIPGGFLEVATGTPFRLLHKLKWLWSSTRDKRRQKTFSLTLAFQLILLRRTPAEVWELMWVVGCKHWDFRSGGGGAIGSWISGARSQSHWSPDPVLQDKEHFGGRDEVWRGCWKSREPGIPEGEHISNSPWNPSQRWRVTVFPVGVCYVKADGLIAR